MSHPAKILTVVTAVAALALTGCRGSSTGDGAASDRGGQAGPVTIDIKVKNGDISPAGERVNATAGQTVKLNVSSDRPDEIHVHSEPEHEFEVEPGKAQTFTFTINRPGVYEVESHKTDTLILSLAVRP